MNVLFISNDPNLFVEESAVRARMRVYAEKLGTLHVLSRGPTTCDITEGPLVLHGLAVNKVRRWSVLIARARELIVSEHIDIVSTQDPFEYGYVGMKACAGTRIPLHVQVHTDFLSPWFTRGGIFRSPQLAMPLKNKIRRHIASLVLPQASGIRVVSKRVGESLQKRYGVRIPAPVCIPIAMNHQVPEPVAFPFSTLPFTLVTIGRLEPEKRIDDSIEAIGKLAEKYPMIGLVIIGEGRERAHLEKKVSDMNLTSRIVFLGARSDAWGLMRSAQGYIQASAYEGYGVTLVEAALARIPIITSDVGIVGEVFTGFQDVLASPPGDPTNLAYQILALIEDVGARELMVRNAEAKALAHLAEYKDTADLIARDLIEVGSGSRKV